ncbi:MAG: glycosyltransferase family 4 protein [Pseudomonadota bacterium]
MHFVFLTSLVSCGPPESGYEIANAAIIDGFRRAGHIVTEIGFKWPKRALSDPDNTVCLGEVELKTEGASGSQKVQWLLKAVANSITFASAKLRVVSENEVLSAIERAAQLNRKVDGVILNGVTLAGAFEKLLTAKPYIFVAHNVEHVSAQQNADDAAGAVEQLMYRREAKYLQGLEARLCAKAQHVLTLTDEDRQGLNIADGERSTTVALVTPADAENANADHPIAFDIGLIGSWTWTPNRIGLEWFLQKVVPQLPEEISIAVAGDMPRGLAQREKRVLFLGRVLDAKEFCRQNRVIALTARAGTGVQLKTIEAFEMGLPCVATPSSLRGIKNIPSNVLVANDAKTFAMALAAQAKSHWLGELPKSDGLAFRQAQIEQMDRAIAKAVSVFADARARGSA